MAAASVLSLAEDTPSRAFTELKVATGVKLEHADFDLTEEGATAMIFDVYSKLLAVGKKLRADKMSAADKAAAFANLKNYCGELLPPNEVAIGLATSEHVQSLTACLALYDAPINVKLGAELVWPPPQNLTLR